MHGSVERTSPALYNAISIDLVEDKRVLELGSGSGLIGIVVASLQSLIVAPSGGALWLTDVNEDVLARCRSNIQLPCSK